MQDQFIPISSGGEIPGLGAGFDGAEILANSPWGDAFTAASFEAAKQESASRKWVKGNRVQLDLLVNGYTDKQKQKSLNSIVFSGRLKGVIASGSVDATYVSELQSRYSNLSVKSVLSMFKIVGTLKQSSSVDDYTAKAKGLSDAANAVGFTRLFGMQYVSEHIYGIAVHVEIELITADSQTLERKAFATRGVVNWATGSLGGEWGSSNEAKSIFSEFSFKLSFSSVGLSFPEEFSTTVFVRSAAELKSHIEAVRSWFSKAVNSRTENYGDFDIIGYRLADYRAMDWTSSIFYRGEIILKTMTAMVGSQELLELIGGIVSKNILESKNAEGHAVLVEIIKKQLAALRGILKQSADDEKGEFDAPKAYADLLVELTSTEFSLLKSVLSQSGQALLGVGVDGPFIRGQLDLGFIDLRLRSELSITADFAGSIRLINDGGNEELHCSVAARFDSSLGLVEICKASQRPKRDHRSGDNYTANITFSGARIVSLNHSITQTPVEFILSFNVPTQPQLGRVASSRKINLLRFISAAYLSAEKGVPVPLPTSVGVLTVNQGVCKWEFKCPDSSVIQGDGTLSIGMVLREPAAVLSSAVGDSSSFGASLSAL